MTLEQIETSIREINILPTFPHIVTQIMSIIDDPMSSATDLAKHMDPSMVGEVLRIANSAYFGTTQFRGIGTLERAIAAIGYEEISHLALQMPFLAMLKPGAGTFDRTNFIAHSTAVGIVARTASSVLGIGEPNEVYISGMLHDIGIIVLYQYFPAEWREILSLMRLKRLPRIEAETAVLSTDHGHVGAALLEMWNVPVQVIEPVKLHHAPSLSVEFHENSHITSFANFLSKAIDMHSDLPEATDLFAAHGDLLASLPGCKLSPEKGKEFFERICLQLRDVQRFVEGLTGDVSAHCDMKSPPPCSTDRER